MPTILLGFVVIVFAINRARFQALEGWQKLFGAVAFVFATVILLQPEFLALGLFGDTAFFDLLVLAMSLQMHVFFSRALRSCTTMLRRSVPWVWIPSPGFSYLMAVSTLLVLSSVSAFQRAVHRMLWMTHYENSPQ